MRKDKSYISRPLAPAAPIKPEDTNFYNVPDSTASNLVLDVLGAGVNIADLPERKKQINRSTAYEVKQKGGKRLVTMKTQAGATEVTIELADIEKLTGSNKPAKKLFVLSLIKANEQAIHNGIMTKDYITFPLQELVSIGFYTTAQSARVGFDVGTDTLTSLKIKGKVSKSKKKITNITDGQDEGGSSVLEVLFTGAKREKGQCFIYLNPRINWGFLTQYFTILPPYYFRLPNRASDLLYYIFYLARQHTKEIEDRGYFTIGFRAIQHKLQLPSEKGAANPQRDIREPIEKAIEQIEEEHNRSYHNTEFALLPVYGEDSTIAEYLDNGYLKVSLGGAFAVSFIEISKDTAKRISEAERRKERIKEKAIIQATAKKITTDEGAG